MHWTRSLAASFVLALTLGAASCGTRDTVEIPYSTLKQHIVKGDVREVRMSATEVRALPTEQRAAGWRSRDVGGHARPERRRSCRCSSRKTSRIKASNQTNRTCAHSRHPRGAYVRHHARHVVQAHEPREVDDGADARPAPGATRREACIPVSITWRAWTRRKKSSRKSSSFCAARRNFRRWARACQRARCSSGLRAPARLSWRVRSPAKPACRSSPRAARSSSRSLSALARRACASCSSRPSRRRPRLSSSTSSMPSARAVPVETAAAEPTSASRR